MTPVPTPVLLPVPLAEYYGAPPMAKVGRPLNVVPDLCGAPEKGGATEH